jgi:hypothetical protein
MTCARSYREMDGTKIFSTRPRQEARPPSGLHSSLHRLTPARKLAHTRLHRRDTPPPAPPDQPKPSLSPFDRPGFNALGKIFLGHFMRAHDAQAVDAARKAIQVNPLLTDLDREISTQKTTIGEQFNRGARPNDTTLFKNMVTIRDAR